MVDAVEKIKDKKSYMSLISQALISYHSELINDQKESVEVSLGELQKLLDNSSEKTATPDHSQAQVQQDSDSDLADLLSLLCGSTAGEENVETLRKKMDDKFIRSLDSKVKPVVVEASELLELKKAIIRNGEFSTDSLTPWPESAENLTAHQRNSLLLHHFTFENKKQMKKDQALPTTTSSPGVVGRPRISNIVKLSPSNTITKVSYP